MNLHKKSWTEGLKTVRYEDHTTSNEKTIKVSLCKSLIITFAVSLFSADHRAYD